MIPKRITVHCSGSRKGRSMTMNELRSFHTSPKPHGRGWSDIGYHFVIDLFGNVHTGRPITRQGAGVKGHNKDTVHICLIGGLDRNGKPAFTYSDRQMEALFKHILHLDDTYPSLDLANTRGHRDYSPDRDGDGKIGPHEYIKQCPCFDVREWLAAGLEAYGLV